MDINSFYINLRPLVTQLVNEDIGLVSEDDIRICELSTGRPCVEYCAPLSVETNVADRFKIKIPYATKYLIWDIIFNSLSPEDPPDFNLNDDNFVRVIDVACLEMFIPSLHTWKYNDVNALRNVISEFVSLYKKYQLDKLKKKYDFCYFEYEAILKTGMVSEKDVEILVTNNGLVHFFLRFYPDLSEYEVPETEDAAMYRAAYIAAQKGNSQDMKQYAIYVSVSYSSSDKMTKPLVRYSSFLQKRLKSVVPSFNDDGLSLTEYLVTLNEKLDESLLLSLKPINRRKRFIFEWLFHYGTNVIEFDAIEFRQASFLLKCDDNFCYILVVEVPIDFTASQPEYKFQSVYSTLITPVVSIPYNQIWNFRVMVSRAISVIKTKVDFFRKLCYENAFSDK